MIIDYEFLNAVKDKVYDNWMRKAELFIGRDIEEFASQYPSEILWAVRKGLIVLSQEQLERCALQSPYEGLKIGHLLSKQCLDFCASKMPKTALEFCAPYLSSRCLTWCAKMYPLEALKYAGYILDKKTFDWCVRKEPYAAIKYAKDRLSAHQMERCQRMVNGDVK